MSDSNSTNRPNDGGPAFPQPASEPGSSLLDAMFGNGAAKGGEKMNKYHTVNGRVAFSAKFAGGGRPHFMVQFHTDLPSAVESFTRVALEMVADWQLLVVAPITERVWRRWGKIDSASAADYHGMALADSDKGDAWIK